MEDKRAPLTDLASLVPPEANVAIGGAWFANHPMAAVRQLVRDGRRDLRAIALLGSIDVDILVGARSLRHLTFSMVTLEAFGLAPSFRAAVEAGELDHTELSALALEVAIEAAGRNVPFLPFPGLGTSDLITSNPDFYSTVRSPFGAEEVPCVRAVTPDVAIVHALRCDATGTAQFDGTFGMDPELARAAKRVIVTCEEIIEADAIASSPHMTKIPGFLVDAVIEAPFGAHPCSHVPRYAVDAWHLLDYARRAGDGQLADYLDELRAESEEEYRSRVLGDGRADVLCRLAADGKPLVRVGDARSLTGAAGG